jgi:hemoglobin
MNTALPFQNRAKESGLTAQLVRNVVIRFYDQIRRDGVLGPIFEDAIGSHWDEHIGRIVQFWLTATRLGRGYNGKNFMPAHLKHRSIHAEHLPRWLGLFRQTAVERCSAEGASVLIDIAERMAETLEIGLTRRDYEGREPNRGN